MTGPPGSELEPTPIDDVPAVVLATMRAAITAAPRGGVVRLSLVDRTPDGDRRATFVVRVEEARYKLGLDNEWSGT